MHVTIVARCKNGHKHEHEEIEVPIVIIGKCVICGTAVVCTVTGLTEPDAPVPDLILLDIELPRMDGYEVARRLKSKPRFHSTVIVMLSRRDGVIDRLKGRLAGARDYITKPFKTQEIIAVAQAYLGVSTPGQG